MSLSFPPKKRIRKRADYLRIQKKSKRINSKYFTICYHFGNKPQPALGIVATKKIGNAVVRNRGKRLIRETFRRHQDLLPPKIEIVIILKQDMLDTTQSTIDLEFLTAIKNIRLK